jgi:hypothetical protein
VGGGKSYFTALSESIHEFVQVDVNGLELTVTAIREDGTQLDHMTMKKNSSRA